MASVAYVAIGSNLDDPRKHVLQAMDDLQALPGTRVRRRSSLYRTAPMGAPGQPELPGAPDFINAVVEVRTTLSAPALLAALQALEAQAQRERPFRNAPRTLDLDLLLYGAARIASPALTVPHPRMRQRAFVLVPLAQLAPALVDPADLASVAAQEIRPLAP